MQRRDFVMSAVGLIGTARLGTAKELRRDVIPITKTGFVDVSVDVGVLLERCPIDTPEDKKGEWVLRVFQEIIEQLEKIPPGDYYVHDSLIAIKKID